MIEKRTKVQLMVFVIITLVGVSFVGARYARLEKIIPAYRQEHEDPLFVVALRRVHDRGGLRGGTITA